MRREARAAFERVAAWHEQMADKRRLDAILSKDRVDHWGETQRARWHLEAAKTIRILAGGDLGGEHDACQHQLYLLRQGLLRAERRIAELQKELCEAQAVDEFEGLEEVAE